MAPYTRGGVWTNVEDEVLRVAIAKYGLNQWARVSSLLSRKTAKQAKARWTEWLDPTIKKVEWSRDEDEKLLHLAKLMPTQWRSIAPLVGRTANQCIERYQELLDDAETRQTMENGKGDSLRLGSTDVAAIPPIGQSSGLQVGDIDAAPEARPAKPDAVDMDDDEKEMLAEARARLANTQGKKAKRKDRERMLEESKRLALLQKRREMKQAGINMKLHNKNKTGMDYNADIPLEHTPAAGFYDTTIEHQENLKDRDQFERTVKRHQLPQGEKDKEQKKQKRESEQSEKDGKRAEVLSRLEQTEQIPKRRKLELPPPQVQDDELEKIIKQTRQSDSTRARFGGEEADLGESTNLENEGLVAGISEDRFIPDTIRETEDLGSAAFLKSTESFSTNNVSRPLSSNVTVSLQDKLKALPKPKNEIEILLPEENDGADELAVEETFIEDRGERDARISEAKEKEKQRQLEMRSTVLRKSLPRPPLNADLFEKWVNSASVGSPEMLIRQEAIKLIISDELKYPREKEVSTKGVIVEDLDLQTRKAVEELITEEAGVQHEKINVTSNAVSFDSEHLLDRLTALSNTCNRYERDLSKVLGGYHKRQSVLTNKLDQALVALQQQTELYNVYKELHDMEDVAISTRLARLQEETDFVVKKEREAQDRYRDLQNIFDASILQT